MFSIFFYRAFDEIVWKNIVQSEATDENMTRVHCMLDN